MISDTFDGLSRLFYLRKKVETQFESIGLFLPARSRKSVKKKEEKGRSNLSRRWGAQLAMEAKRAQRVFSPPPPPFLKRPRISS